MKKTTVGFAMTGSYCTFEKNLAQMEELVRRNRWARRRGLICT